MVTLYTSNWILDSDFWKYQCNWVQVPDVSDDWYLEASSLKNLYYHKYNIHNLVNYELFVVSRPMYR